MKTPMIDAALLDILVCPVPECRAALTARDDCLECVGCGRVYPVEDGWPVLIPEEATQPEVTENE